MINPYPANVEKMVS